MKYIIDVKPENWTNEHSLDFENQMFGVVELYPNMIEMLITKIKEIQELKEKTPELRHLILENQDNISLYRPDEELENLFYKGSAYVDIHLATPDELSIINSGVSHFEEYIVYIEKSELLITDRSIRFIINDDLSSMPIFIDELEEFLNLTMGVKKPSSISKAIEKLDEIIESSKEEKIINDLKDIRQLLATDEQLLISWHIDDIIHQAETLDIEISKTQAQNILSLLGGYHDADVGINWSVINSYLEQYDW